MPCPSDVKIIGAKITKHTKNSFNPMPKPLLKMGKKELMKMGKENIKNGQRRRRQNNISLSDSDKDSHNTQKIIADKIGWSTGKPAKAKYTKDNNPDHLSGNHHLSNI
jgi:hypothetical protein